VTILRNPDECGLNLENGMSYPDALVHLTGMRTTAALVAGALLSVASLVGAGTAAAQPITVIPIDGLYLVGE
jgi:hypothetical protein